MTWTTPKTWAVNDILTAADMNTYVRDNVQMLGQPPLAIATPNTGANNGVSIPHAAVTKIVWPVRLFDQDPSGNLIYDPATGNFTIRTAGKYKADAQVAWSAPGAPATVTRRIIYLNRIPSGGAVAEVSRIEGPSSTIAYATGQSLDAPETACGVGDVLYFSAYQNSGAALLIDNSAGTTMSYGRVERTST